MSTPFEMAGQFGGFVFTEAGKRRMLLRCGEETCLLKVPRLLRRRIIGKFGLGESIRVAGLQERDPATGVLKQIVSQVLPSGGHPVPMAAVVACTIRVCAKKNCWRQGGQELFQAIDRQLDALGRPENIKLKAVGCLDHCKQAPNVECGSHVYKGCTPRDAEAMVTRIASRSLQPSEV